MLGQLQALIASGAIKAALAAMLLLAALTPLPIVAEGAAEACAAKKATVVVARRILKNVLRSMV